MLLKYSQNQFSFLRPTATIIIMGGVEYGGRLKDIWVAKKLTRSDIFLFPCDGFPFLQTLTSIVFAQRQKPDPAPSLNSDGKKWVKEWICVPKKRFSFF